MENNVDPRSSTRSPGRRALRHIWSSEMRRDIVSTWRLARPATRVLFFFNLSWLFLQFTMTTVVLVLTFHDECDRPLREFSLLMVVITALNIPLYVLETLWRLPLGEGFYVTPRGILISRLNGTLETTSLVAYVLGNIWLFTSETCSITSPLLFDITFLWVLYGYFMVTFPVLYCLLLFFCLPVAFYLSGSHHAADESHSGLSKSQIDSLPTIKYEKKNSEDCSICLCEFEDHEVVRLMPKCQHIYHLECIDGWLSTHMTCPLCVSKVVE